MTVDGGKHGFMSQRPRMNKRTRSSFFFALLCSFSPPHPAPPPTFFFSLPQNLCAKWVEVDLVCTSKRGFNVTCYGKLWQKYVVSRSQQLCWLAYWWFKTTVSVIKWWTDNIKSCVFTGRRNFYSMRLSWVTMLYWHYIFLKTVTPSWNVFSPQLSLRPNPRKVA